MGRAATTAAAAVAVGWAALAAGRGRWWSTATRLPDAPPPARWPSVVAVVPARNEAPVVADSVGSLLASDYPGRLRVVLVDDDSDDSTAEAARSAQRQGGRVALDVVRAPGRPEGWVGKLWAVHWGVRTAVGGLSPHPPDEPPEWLLLTDADIVHPPDSVRRLVAAAAVLGADEVSLMARLRTDTGWERLIVPAFVYFFAQLYPFRWVAAGRTAAAAGGCILVRRTVLEAAGGVAAIRGAVIDDVALARLLRRRGASLWLGLADDVRSIRPYPRLGDLWDMVARSADTQLRHSPLLLAGTLAGLAAGYLGPPGALLVGLARRDLPLAVAGAAGWAVLTATYLPTVRYHRLAPAWALSLPAAAALYGAMTADSARRHRLGRGAAWKGRTYGPSPAPAAAQAAPNGVPQASRSR